MNGNVDGRLVKIVVSATLVLVSDGVGVGVEAVCD